MPRSWRCRPSNTTSTASRTHLCSAGVTVSASTVSERFVPCSYCPTNPSLCSHPARARLLRHALDADVEPDGAVERRLLGDDEVLELGRERGGFVGVGEVAAFDAPLGNRVDDAVGHLLQRRLSLGGAGRATEVLLG